MADNPNSAAMLRIRDLLRKYRDGELSTVLPVCRVDLNRTEDNLKHGVAFIGLLDNTDSPTPSSLPIPLFPSLESEFCPEYLQLVEDLLDAGRIKPHFEIYHGVEGYGFRLKRHGEVILSGRTHAEKSDCLHNIASAMKFGSNDCHFVRKETTDGAYNFQLKTAQGRTIGWSEMFNSRTQREQCIMAVRMAIPTATITELKHL